ncbi:MAG: SH3 domain-containing protein [Anaerolineae bacterium]
MKRLLFLVWVLWAIIGQVGAQEAEPPWSVWVYDRTQARAIQVDQDGAVLADVTLPIPAPYLAFDLAPNLAIAPNGERMAYAVTGTDADGQALSAFLVYDVASDDVLFTYEPPDYALASSLDFSRVAWNSTGNIVAFAYAFGDDLETQAWRIAVFNAIDGRELAELDDKTPFFSAQAENLAPYLLPVLQFYGEATLGFNLIPYQTLQFSAELFSYEWDIITGRVIQTNRAPRITGDTLQSTGESISPITDERTNYDDANAPYTNALHVYRPELGARAPFFATRTYDLLRAQFVQNGDQVLVTADDLLTFERSYLLVNRIGVLRGLPALNALDEAFIGTPEGFVYVVDNALTPVLIAVDTRDVAFPQRALWTAPADSRFVPMWATLTPQEDYEAWLQLAPPIFPTQVIVPGISAQGIDPNDINGSNPSNTITINTVAIITTTGGDRLNMRDNPGLDSTIIARVESGARVVVLDGPVLTDSFTWWQIRLSTGQVGWVVESADGVQTLVPGN